MNRMKIYILEQHSTDRWERDVYACGYYMSRKDALREMLRWNRADYVAWDSRRLRKAERGAKFDHSRNYYYLIKEVEVHPPTRGEITPSRSS